MTGGSTGATSNSFVAPTSNTPAYTDQTTCTNWTDVTSVNMATDSGLDGGFDEPQCFGFKRLCFINNGNSASYYTNVYSQSGNQVKIPTDYCTHEMPMMTRTMPT